MTVRVNTPASEAPAEAPVKDAPQATAGAPDAPASNPQASPQSAPETPPQPGPPTVEHIEGQFQARGMNLDKYADSYRANGGKLTDGDYAELAKGGFSKDYVDAFIRGQEALVQQEENSVFETVGGRESYAKMTAWAKVNVSSAEIEAFNQALDTMPLETVKFMVAGLKARYEASNGNEPSLVNGQKSGAVAGYQSVAQLTAEMRDPRYRKDPAFRAEVERKLASSNIF